MKLKLRKLCPNPYKRWINKGKTNQQQVETIKASLDELGLMGSIPVVKRKNKYHLVSHHHRVEALKQKFGDEYEVNVTFHNYTNAQLFRGMVIENLTQRAGEFREIMENCVATKTFLTENLEELCKLRDSRNLLPKKRKHLDTQNPKPTNKDIALWLDPDERVISHDTVRDMIGVAENLDESLINETEKTHSGSADRRGEILSQTQSIYLSKFEDKDEQKKLAVALKTSTEQRVRAQGKLISIYKKSPKKVKEMVLNRDIDLRDVEQAKINYEESQEPIQMDDVISPDKEFVDRMQRKFEDIYMYNRTTLSPLNFVQVRRAYQLLEALQQQLTNELDYMRKIIEERKIYEGK